MVLSRQATYGSVRDTSMIEQAFEIFGKDSFSHSIFYNNEECLRFELSEGESYVEMFTSALYKSTQVIETIFEQSSNVSICLAFSGSSYLSHLNVFKELKDLQIEIPKENFQFKEWVEDDEWYKNYLFFNVKKSEIHKLLFGKLGAELGIKPSFWFDLYIYDLGLGILAHPYDDRGLDVVGTNKAIMQNLYKQYHGYLLEHDLDTMREWFGSL